MKTALITGGTSGIGLSMAKALLQKKYKVYLMGRNSEKGKAIESALDTQYPGNVKFIQLDLSNISGVKIFSKQFLEDHSKLMDFSVNYNSFRTAITTVHAKTVLTEILSKKYASKGIDVNSFHPGAVRSDLMQNMPWWGRLMDKLLSPFMSTTSKTGIYVCSSPDIQGTSGKYFKKKKALTLNFEKSYRERLWQESEDLIGRV